MSAFKVTDNHVRLIAYAACSGRYPLHYYWRGKERRLSMSDIDRVCTLLGKENDRSLRARYPQDHKTLGTKRAVKIAFICASGVISAEDKYNHYGESAGFTFITASRTSLVSMTDGRALKLPQFAGALPIVLRRRLSGPLVCWKMFLGPISPHSKK